MSVLANETRTAMHARLADLRRMLAGKFPVTEQKPGGILRTGLADVDSAEGGLRRAALTEFSGTSGAGALFLHALLRAICREHCLAALVDAARTFEPDACPRSSLARMLVVLCADAMQAVKAADLLLRDGNLSLVMLDLQAVPPAQLRRIPANTWHRFQRLAEQTTAAVVVLTPQPMVEAAQVRITGAGADGNGWTLAAQRRWRHELFSDATWRVFPRHRSTGFQPVRSEAIRAAEPRHDETQGWNPAVPHRSQTCAPTA
jgi:hypothetical protein